MLVDSHPRPESTRLPAWSTMLAVVAHPDDESFGLGAILDAFHLAGTRTAVLCLTPGEASTLHGVTGELTAVGAREFAEAARTLGVTDTVLRDFPDGSLGQICRSRLMGEEVQQHATDDHRHQVEGPGQVLKAKQRQHHPCRPGQQLRPPLAGPRCGRG